MYFLSKVCVTPAEATALCCNSMSQSSSDLWAREGKKRFMASWCYSLFTPKACVDDEEFWREKLLGIFNSRFIGNFNTRRGQEDEPFARWKYEQTRGASVHAVGLLVHLDAPWLGCSPDGIVDGRILLEIKSPESGIISPASDVAKNLRYIRRDKHGNLSLSPRHPFYGQVQLNMFLTGLSLCHFVLYASFDGSIAVVDVPFDRVFVEALVDKLTAIYFKHYVRILREDGRR